MTRSQIHKERIQGVRSDGSFVGVTRPNALVDQTSTSGVADSYQFAANSFATPDAGLPVRYEAQSIVGGTPVPLQAGIAFNEATRTFSWTLTGAGTRVIRVTARNNLGEVITDDFNIVVS